MTDVASDPGMTPMLRGICDDAAIFPPGLMPLHHAVPAHRAHLASDHSGLVGGFIVSAAALGELAGLIEATDTFEVAVTVPEPSEVAAMLALAEVIAGLRVVAVEVVVPEGVKTETVVPTLTGALDDREGVAVFVELPRDERRLGLIAALACTPYLAKLRTGGVSADLYPDERELAEAIVALVSAGVPFKATAGLHEAVRNTDPTTGFEQHGFLNLLSATHTAQQGGDIEAVITVLAERDPARVLAVVGEAAAAGQVRRSFRSFGTCSVTDPRDQMANLGLPTTHLSTDPTADPTADEGAR